jgi:predicted ATP-grasp superfamily ATP-dependent carboligase
MADPAVLIAAASGRALAGSARRGGYVPLVADFFCDQDTVAMAPSHVRINDGLAHGMDGDRLIDALETLAAPSEPIGIVWGSGFEDRPALLARLAQRWRLIGNGAQTVAQVKDPMSFAALCGDCDIAHPETRAEPPDDPEGWLVKRKGGAGGVHIASAARADAFAGERYFQRRVGGVPVSALFLAAGRRAATIGFSTQWCAPAPARPFRYGGAVRPAALAPGVADALGDVVQRLAQAVPLVGLNSADFLVDGDDFQLLEINPRPGATLDVFEPATPSLFALHVAACAGELGSARPRLEGAHAAAIVYAERDIAAFPALEWPAWAADRPHPGTAVKAGEPLCTVSATATTAAAARSLVDERLATVLAWTHARMS